MASTQRGLPAQYEAVPQPRLGTARVILQEVWNEYRDEITERYIHQGSSLLDLMELMDEKYHLKATYDALNTSLQTVIDQKQRDPMEEAVREMEPQAKCESGRCSTCITPLQRGNSSRSETSGSLPQESCYASTNQSIH